MARLIRVDGNMLINPEKIVSAFRNNSGGVAVRFEGTVNPLQLRDETLESFLEKVNGE